MTCSVRRLIGVARLFAAVLAMAAPAAFAQGGATSTLSGTVVDSQGGVIPGASVVVKNMATNAASDAVTNDQGLFTIPALNAGTYSVTVTLAGFKTVTLNDIIVNAGVPAGVKVTLEVGGLEEQVVVQAASEVVATQSSTVATTLNAKQIQNLPLTSRNALDFVVNLPGVNTPGTARNSTVNGLPQGAINITLDGMNIQDNYLKTTDGFFTRVQPRLDAIEEVTVTSAANGADSAGQGAVNIRFVTKSGTNTFRGNLFHTYRNDALNANTFFNNRNLKPDPKTGKAPKNDLLLNQPGFNAGGPIMIPGLFDGHDKAFFFVNYEESRQPSKITRNRTILNPRAQQGIFRYTVSGSVREVDLLTLAAAANQTATFDPVISKLLGDMRSASQQGQIVDLTDPLLQQATFQVNSRNYTPYPTVRVDYNVSKNHRLTGSYNYNHVNSTPDTTNSREPFFPGFPNTGSQQSTRWTTSEFVRSTFGGNLVNEFHFGGTGGATLFSPELSPALFGGTSVGDQGGFYLNLGNACCGNNTSALANAGNSANFSAREASTKVVEDTLNWLRGKHNLSFGASMTQGQLWLKNQQMVPELRFGIVSGDPAASLFNTTNFPGASTTQLNNARALYAILTGRISSLRATARLNEGTGQYEYLGNGFQRGRMHQWGFFAQDNWRVRTNLTVNAGVRYELQLPFYPLNNSYSTATLADICGVSGMSAQGSCNLFQPGTLAGQKPALVNYSKGANSFNTDRNNFAPSLGLTWRPMFEHGILRQLTGIEGDTVLFASYAMSYERPGMADYSGVFGDNPGVALTVNRDLATNTLGPVPLLFRDTSRLGAAPFPATQQYPLTPQITDTIHIFNPNLQVPYAQSWAGGIRRKITDDIGLEVRYVGTRHLQGWGTFDLNEANIVENGFLQEFRHAQNNLRANIAAGPGAGCVGGVTTSNCQNTFAYTGAPGTVPLPIYLAYFSGTRLSQANDPGNYTSSLFRDSGFVNPLAMFNPNPFAPASDSTSTTATGLYSTPERRSNALAAGLPANFFVLNPDVSSAQIESNSGYTKYDSLQIDVNKRLTHGLLLQGGYVFGKAYSSSRYSLRTPRRQTPQTGGEGGITHALKANWVYELPFGQGRAFAGNAGGLLDRLIGGWEFDGVFRLQSGQMLDFGNVQLVGMSKKDLQKAFKLYEYAATGLNASAPVNIYMLPQDILENTFKAFSVSATSATGYGSLGAPSGRYLAPANGPDCIETAVGFGDCGVRTLVVTGPLYQRWDLSAVKRTRLVGHTTFEFRADMINAFNHPNFTPVISTSTNADNYRVTAVQENSNRVIQLVARFSW